jgi:hypothetical protein
MLLAEDVEGGVPAMTQSLGRRAPADNDARTSGAIAIPLRPGHQYVPDPLQSMKIDELQPASFVTIANGGYLEVGK